MAGNDTFVENLDAVKSSVRLVAEHINRIKEKFPSLPQLEKQLSGRTVGYKLGVKPAVQTIVITGIEIR